MKKTINTEEAKKKNLKPEWQPGGSRRQELLDKAVEYLKAPIMETQAARHHFCLNNLMMTETEYLEALNKAVAGEQKTRSTNGPGLPGPLAMARGSGTKLQATSRKLQAPSRKLDKSPVLCYRIFKEKV